MAEKDFHVSLPQEVVGGFGWKESEVPSRVTLGARNGSVTPRQAVGSASCGLLGVARWELLELMGRYDVPAVRMSAEELDRELAT